MGGGTPVLLDNRTDPGATLPSGTSALAGSTCGVAQAVVVAIAAIAVAPDSPPRRAPVRAGGHGQPRPVGQQRHGLAERQPQRQQLALPGGRHRAVPPGHRGAEAGDHSIHINYDFTAGGHKAYDFLATWNVTNATGKICGPGGGGDLVDVPEPADAIESCTFPSDSFEPTA